MEYWFSKHQVACEQWLSANTQQQYRLYNILHPPIRIMTEIIANRYFSINFSNQKLVYEEVINHFFLNLITYNPKRQKAFTFASILIKNAIYDREAVKDKPRDIQLSYIDNYDNYDDCQSIYSDNKEIDIMALLKRFAEIRIRIRNDMASRSPSGFTVMTSTRGATLLRVVDCCEEYLLKFQNFNSSCVADYCINNLNINRSTLSIYLGHLFNYHILVNDYRDYQSLKKKISLVQDDYYPNESHQNRWQNRLRMKKMGNIQDYNYF